MKNNRHTWLLVYGENFESIQPMYMCSKCNNIISEYSPPDKCDKCKSKNKYNGHSVYLKME